MDSALARPTAHKVLPGILQQIYADVTFKGTILSITYALLALLTHIGTEIHANVILITFKVEAAVFQAVLQVQAGMGNHAYAALASI